MKVKVLMRTGAQKHLQVQADSIAEATSVLQKKFPLIKKVEAVTDEDYRKALKEENAREATQEIKRKQAHALEEKRSAGVRKVRVFTVAAITLLIISASLLIYAISFLEGPQGSLAVTGANQGTYLSAKETLEQYELLGTPNEDGQYYPMFRQMALELENEIKKYEQRFSLLVLSSMLLLACTLVFGVKALRERRSLVSNEPAAVSSSD